MYTRIFVKVYKDCFKKCSIILYVKREFINKFLYTTVTLYIIDFSATFRETVLTKTLISIKYVNCIFTLNFNDYRNLKTKCM